MKRAAVVIGANFGDEGKGVITDLLASRHGGPDATVVRFNGGAQAGHTVTTPAGRRHVFSHFASGTLAGATTYLAEHFVCNPMLFCREAAALRDLKPTIEAHPFCMVTTPFDMLINQFVESARGTARHGSCGVGFGETIERYEVAAIRMEQSPRLGSLVYAKDDHLRAWLRDIRDHYLPRRLAAFSVFMTPQQAALVNSEWLIENYIRDFRQMADAIRITEYEALAGREVIFEGAQGLLLDQGSGYFPHVTRSHTGCRNVGTLARAAGITALDVIYVTRAYLTRHGAGPLPNEEMAGLPYNIVDATNIAHEYQGGLRFAHLDFYLLRHAIRQDLYASALSFFRASEFWNDAPRQINAALAVTCLDQIGDVWAWSGNILHRYYSPNELLSALERHVDIPVRFTSHGPTRADVVEHSQERVDA